MKQKIISIFLILAILAGAVPAALADGQAVVYTAADYQHMQVACGTEFIVEVIFSGLQYTSIGKAIYKVDLTGTESAEEIKAIALKQLESGSKPISESFGYGQYNSWGTTLLGGVAPREPGSYVAVFYTFSYSGPQYDPDILDIDESSVFGLAVHVVKEQKPITDLEYYLCDDNGENPTLIEGALEISASTGNARILVKSLPEDATDRVTGLIWADAQIAVGPPINHGDGTYSIGQLKCGQGKVVATLHSGTVMEALDIRSLCTPATVTEVVTAPTATKPGLGTGSCVCCGAAGAQAVIPAVFTDTAADAYYADAVDYCYAENIVKGMTQTTFGPSETISRGQIVTLLHRLAGTPAPENPAPFQDVAESAYYHDAVSWAAELGIAKGMTETQFAPDTPVTRQQLATFMYRFAEAFGLDASERKELSIFEDRTSVSDYAVDAVSWAVAKGLINGMTPTTLCPLDQAQRAQFVTILHRFIQAYPELSGEEKPEEPAPEESIPEESVPGESVPEESVPDESAPEGSVPEASTPNA